MKHILLGLITKENQGLRYLAQADIFKMNLRKRFGNFFLVIGISLLFLFFISDVIEIPNGWYLFIGAILAGFGTYLYLSGLTPTEPAQRFRRVRRVFSKEERAKARAIKKQEKQEKKEGRKLFGRKKKDSDG